MSQALLIKQVKSESKLSPKQRATLRSIGLKGLHTSIYRTDTRAVRGMLNKLHHIIRAEQVDGNTHKVTKTTANQRGIQIG